MINGIRLSTFYLFEMTGCQSGAYFWTDKMPHKTQTKDQRINDIEESLKLTREQKLLVER